MCVRRTIDLYRRGKDLSEPGMQQEARDLLLASVEAARETYRTMLWVVLDFTGRIYGHPKQYEFEGCVSAFGGFKQFRLGKVPIVLNFDNSVDETSSCCYCCG